SNPKREREYRGRCEARAAPKHANGVAQVLKRGLEPHENVLLPRGLLHEAAVAEHAPGFFACAGRAHALGDEICRTLLDMKCDLGIEVALHAPAPQRAYEPIDPRHGHLTRASTRSRRHS